MFQNRYKSILCQEDPYLRELVRYIHLNPLRATIVADYKSLSKHPYCGHGVILGNAENDWQDRQYVLRLFGNQEGEAKRNYRLFVRKGIGMGKRSEFSGGGLLRSLGGWEALKANRRAGDYQKGDERILGNGDFVQEVLDQAEERMKNRYRLAAKGFDFDRVLARVAEITQLEPRDILDRQRDRARTRARSLLCFWATDQLGLPQTELARVLNQTQPAISTAVRRGKMLVEEKGWKLFDE